MSFLYNILLRRTLLAWATLPRRSKTLASLKKGCRTGGWLHSSATQPPFLVRRMEPLKKMSHHLFPTSKFDASMSSQSDTKGNRERGNEEGNMVPGQFVPFATPTPTIPSSWNLCFGWQDSKESELGERQRNCIGILHEVDCEWLYILLPLHCRRKLRN